MKSCTCPFCGKSWSSDNGESVSAEDMIETCKRCGFEWKSRTNKPLKCPKCGSYSWNKPVNRCLCKLCGHDWISRMDDTPSKCPMCKSNKWNTGPAEMDNSFKNEDTEVIGARERWVCKKYQEGLGCVKIASRTGMPFTRVVDIIRINFGKRSVRP